MSTISDTSAILLVEKCEEVCTAVESLISLKNLTTTNISIDASVAKVRVFYYIQKRAKYSHKEFSEQGFAYDKLWYLFYNTESGWKQLSKEEQYALMRSLQILHNIFVYV